MTDQITKPLTIDEAIARKEGRPDRAPRFPDVVRLNEIPLYPSEEQIAVAVMGRCWC